MYQATIMLVCFGLLPGCCNVVLRMVWVVAYCPSLKSPMLSLYVHKYVFFVCHNFLPFMKFQICKTYSLLKRRCLKQNAQDAQDFLWRTTQKSVCFSFKASLSFEKTVYNCIHDAFGTFRCYAPFCIALRRAAWTFFKTFMFHRRKKYRFHFRVNYQ